ncbi:hypothetical protein DL98DRAFT_428701 [Cadophora sp. DSE1049]|nr:hypothetical protein DL98DRAFT_428701 [Cadophora sp. DSE1049]
MDDNSQVEPQVEHCYNEDSNAPSPQTFTGPHTTNEAPARVWRACLECRKRKSKCDGKEKCRSCTLKNRDCVYFESNDNASGSRQATAMLDQRYQQMDALCQKMEDLMGQFNTSLQILNTATGRVELQSSQNLETTAEVDKNCDNSESDDSEGGELDGPENVGKGVADHYMTTDSYGKLRFVGGTSNMVIIEALKSLSPQGSMTNVSTEAGPTARDTDPLEFPFFTRGVTWPRLPGLAKPEQLALPPRYISDLLINLYFDQLHYTMPVLYRPHFMQRYRLLLASRSSGNIDAGFLSVFFAVCACAAGLLPREPGQPAMFTGLRYYENAVSLHYASTGEGSVERVQCLALLSMTTSGWNTLSQSWLLAGQACRAAQEIGLHVRVLKEELCRRVWWSVYGLDRQVYIRVLSNCLGRPMAVEDGDCDCEIPLDLDDEELEGYCRSPNSSFLNDQKTSRLTGFIVFSKLCKVSGQIARSMTSLMLQHKDKSLRKGRKLRRLVTELENELSQWLQEVPDVIKFSVNDFDQTSPYLTMCVISYSIHAGCIINLHRPLIPNHLDSDALAKNPSYQKCINAARNCIQIAEFFQSHVPQSHHLAICTHYLTLSGVFL